MSIFNDDSQLATWKKLLAGIVTNTKHLNKEDQKKKLEELLKDMEQESPEVRTYLKALKELRKL